jgi:hypothetical protein
VVSTVRSLGAAVGVNTTFQLGGALGVAMLSLIAAREIGAANPLRAAALMADGQSLALWMAVLFARAGIPFMVWQRGSRSEPISDGHGDGSADEHAATVAAEVPDPPWYRHITMYCRNATDHFA